MASGLYTSSHDWSNDFVAHLTSDITSGATSIPLDSIPTGTEGCLVIDPDTPASMEIIFYTSKTGTTVVTPANGRGYDSSTASAHLSGTKVIMAPIADDFRYIRTVATTTPQGWTPLASAPNTVTALGNRSYSLVFNAVDYTATVSPGMRLKTTRTVAAPTQCTSLNGSTQYYSKTSPTGMTFTNNFVAGGWIKLASYPSNLGAIASRYNGTSGWALYVNSAGGVELVGWNAGAGNFSRVVSYQSVPLNKWVQVTAQLDMASFTATPTTSYVMLDGVDVPCSVSRSGTNPTALVQAGNLEIGSHSSGTANTLFPGKIAQVAIYSAKVTQATILASMHQTLAGTETSLISAYSFNNSINDLNANANNLTANGSAVATNTDSPFGGQADGTISSTLDYAIVTKTAFSTNTTLTVQVPEGCTIPTSGGVSAVSYATVKAPYGMPVGSDKWRLTSKLMSSVGSTSNATYGSFNSGGYALTVPLGVWDVGHQHGGVYNTSTTTVYYNISPTALTGLTATTGFNAAPWAFRVKSSGAAETDSDSFKVQPQNVTSQSTYVMYTLGATTASGIDGTGTLSEIFAEFKLL